MFECELKQAFIMWPQPWSPWCWERGPATDIHCLLASVDAFPSAMSLSLPLTLIPFSTLLLVSNPAFPSFSSLAQPFHLNHFTSLAYSYSSSTVAFLFHAPLLSILHEEQLLQWPLKDVFICGFRWT